MPRKIKKARENSKSLHICEHCDKEFDHLSNLKIHRRVHTGERPFPCNLCGYSTTKKSNLQVHIRRHLQEKLFQCPEHGCNFSSVTKSEVTTHQHVHTQEKPFSCSLCSFKSGQKINLTVHMTTHEENPEKPFQCQLCPFKTKRRSNIPLHMIQVHSEERKFKCPHSSDGCGFAGKTKSDLNQHLQTHREKTLCCPHPNCEYRTNQKYALKLHERRHSSEKKWKCRICSYACHTSNYLTVHMRSHTKERPYKCQVGGCEYAGKESRDLRAHVKVVHEKVGPFECSFSGCSFAAARKDNLRKHQIRQHVSPDLDSDPDQPITGETRIENQ